MFPLQKIYLPAFYDMSKTMFLIIIWYFVFSKKLDEKKYTLSQLGSQNRSEISLETFRNPERNSHSRR